MYKNYKSTFGLGCFFLLSLSLLQAQSGIQVMEFEELDQYMHRDSDTTFVYNFWATWCVPCVAELPHFERLNKEYADKKVQVILVSLDFVDSWEEILPRFLKMKGIASKVIFLNDERYNDWIPKVSPEWSGALPCTLVVHTPSNTRAFKEQSFHYEGLSEWIDEIIQKP